MASMKLSFSLRTTSSVKQVHLIGSWDSYQGQLPLAREGSKWKGTFRFSSSLMQPGQRYWFYYMLDGYQVSHDPSKEFTVEPTTGRKLNILDVPASSSSKSDKKSKDSSSSKRSSRRYSREIPRGQPASEIRSPKPVRPSHLARKLEEAALDALSAQLAAAELEDIESESEDEDDYSENDCPSLTSGGSSDSGRSSPSSVASSSCSCERYGITRKGDRVKLDCGGSRCGYDCDGCEDSAEEEYQARVSRSHRRHATRG